jgi:hypothetical protein
MADTQKKNNTKDQHAINPIVAGIAGAFAGGIAIATAVVMSDKKNQKKVTEALKNAKDSVTKKLVKS